MLSIQPYKDELLPNWRFKSPDVAQHSSETIYKQFLAYRDAGDFCGMDMARKFLQMGFTRARRYANHKSGIKRQGGELLPLDQDAEKAECAAIFKVKLDAAKADSIYMAGKVEHLKLEAATTARLAKQT